MTILTLAAIAALFAFAAAPYAAAAETAPRGPRFWAVTVVAVAGSASLSWVLFASGWHAGLAPALWLTIAVTMGLFLGGSVLCSSLARIAALLGPYLLVLAIIATIWSHAPERAVSAAAPEAWLAVHIVVSVATYALFTLAAVAGASVFVQERALKARRPSRLTALLPAVADGESLQRVLMAAAAVVLGLGLASGMVIEYIEGRPLLPLTHKPVLALLAFVVIVLLIGWDRLSGITGRRAARIVLLAYLLLTLAYPGVKFVTDVILARG